LRLRFRRWSSFSDTLIVTGSGPEIGLGWRKGTFAMSFLLQWLVSGLAIIITAYLLPGVQLTGVFAALVTALILGLINAFIRPVLLLLTLPLNILTLGLFTLVVNALLILLAAAIVPGFLVQGFWWAFLFGLVLAIINFTLSKLLP
jgi:putative membrane protein